MFTKIMTPVDLAHVDRLGRSLDCAADLARHYRASVTYVGVTSTAPGAVAHTPQEFSQKLAAFADAQAEQHGIDTAAHMVTCNDPAAEVDAALMRAIDDTGADLVIMASHVPGAIDYIWPSNGGKLAEHAKCSVMVVRL